MSTRRAPNIPEIPPFRGAGPLQSRNAPNRPSTSSGEHDGKAMAPPSQGSQNRRADARQGSSSSGRSERERQAAKQQQRAQAPAEPRPSSRLASEKKRDYKDPPSIGPWQLGKLIGQGASGEYPSVVPQSCSYLFFSLGLADAVTGAGRTRSTRHPRQQRSASRRQDCPQADSCNESDEHARREREAREDGVGN